ncbi:hypothetical protein LTR08_001987 [Meristemomyces frigidus]|nr:hypothetical protein LTR08_001987 [Meristemomyces frigidus]
MKRVRLDRWAAQTQAPRNPRIHLQRCAVQQESGERRETQRQRQPAGQGPLQQQQWQPVRRHVASRRKASTSTSTSPPPPADSPPEAPGARDSAARQPRNSPSPARALQSAKLAALHARLALPAKLPLQTLARCLVDASADPRPGFNNTPFAVLGHDLLGYYTTEHLLCHYPRLPMPVLFAAQYGYAGPATLAALRAEWGVDVVAAPGEEVDAGLLQLKRAVAGNSMVEGEARQVKDLPLARRLGSGRRNDEQNYRRGMSSRIVFDDQFGDLQSGFPPPDSSPYPGAAISTPADSAPEPSAQLASFPSPAETDPTTVETASATFIRALTGALYLHAGSARTKAFHAAHILSRQLPLHTLFAFTHPTRDLSRLCLRENFEPPVARLVSETGRLSRTPVFVVGVFSGDEKLGEGAGSSLNEARVRAAAAALRGWYLYSPPSAEVVLPSEVEGSGSGLGGKRWKAQMVDRGEIVT